MESSEGSTSKWLVGALMGMGALAALVLGGCSNPGARAVAALEAEPVATAEIDGVSQTGATATNPGSSGAAGSPATLRRDLVAQDDDLVAAIAATVDAARSTGWSIEPNPAAVEHSYTGTKSVGGRIARITITPTPDENGGYANEFQLELSLRWSG